MSTNYRKGVVVIVLDDQDQFLILQLQSYGGDEWNFVGGGAEKDETPLENLERELSEELGLSSADYKVLAKSVTPQQYDFPEPQVRDGVLYSGQIKEQFLVRFTGDKAAIVLQAEEVNAHKWVKFSELKDHLVFPNQYETALKTLQELYPEVIVS